MGEKQRGGKRVGKVIRKGESMREMKTKEKKLK